MRRALLMLGILGVAVVFVGCGSGDGSSENSKAAGASGPQGTSGPTGPTTPTGPTGTTVPGRQKKKAERTGDASPGANTGGSTSGSPTTTRARTPSQQRTGEQRKLTGLRLQLYKGAKENCRVVPTGLLVGDVKPKSSKPEDVARAYAKAFIRDDRPAAREAVYQGCLAGLKKRARR